MWWEEISEWLALLMVGAIALASIKYLPQGGGKEVALTIGGGIIGYIAKTIKQNRQG